MSDADGKRVTNEWKRPESVLVVVYTRDRQFLLLERRVPAEYWQSVTGSLEWGESAAQAAARELHEETGLSHAGLQDTGVRNHFPIHPAWRPRYAPEVTQNLEHVYTLELPAVIDIQFDPREHTRYAWLDAEAALARATSATNRSAIARVLGRAVPG